VRAALRWLGRCGRGRRAGLALRPGPLAHELLLLCIRSRLSKGRWHGGMENRTLHGVPDSGVCKLSYMYKALHFGSMILSLLLFLTMLHATITDRLPATQAGSPEHEQAIADQLRPPVSQQRTGCREAMLPRRM